MNEFIFIKGIRFNRASVDGMFGSDSEKVWNDGRAEVIAAEAKAAVRTAIRKQVGDTETILGTTADVTQLNAAAILAFIASIKTGDSFAKFRTTFMGTIESLVPPTEGADVYTQAQGFLQGVQSGDIILTAALKGLPEVIADMAGRSTGVATILAQAKAGVK